MTCEIPGSRIEAGPFASVFLPSSSTSTRETSRVWGHLSHRYLGPKPEAADDLIRVMQAALDHSLSEQRRHEHRLRDDLEKLNRHERLSLPRANTTVPGSADIRMGRKKFQNIKRASQRKRGA